MPQGNGETHPKTIEIFKTGVHRAMSGDTLSFTESDLQTIAGNYDPAVHEAPIVIGHPKHNAPAYGWIKSLSADGDVLTADPHQVNPAFAEMVDEGAFKKISASFYRPGQPGNPTDAYYLRHVGFLGAQPPAVKGLKQAEFADDEEGVVTIEFSDIADDAGWALKDVARIFQRLRDFMVEKHGVESADKVISSWDISQLTQDAANIAAEAAQDLAAREQNLAEREAAFAEQETAARSHANEAVLDGLIEQGRLRPADKDDTLRFMESLADAMSPRSRNPFTAPDRMADRPSRRISRSASSPKAWSYSLMVSCETTTRASVFHPPANPTVLVPVPNTSAPPR